VFSNSHTITYMKGDDQENIKDLMQHLYRQLQTKELGQLCKFIAYVMA
jgi:uncharacterized protein (UPF0297 family)